MFIILAILKKLTANTEREAQLISKISKEDEAALSELYQLYQRLLFSLCYSILKNKEDAEEVLQEVFIQVWEKAPYYNRDKGTPYAWLTTMTRNRCIDRIRSKAYKKSQITDHDDNDVILPFIVSNEHDPFSATLAQERTSMVQKVLNLIPDEQRDVLTFAYFEGYSQSEISDKTGIPLGTVKSRMRQGLLKLQQLLEGREDSI
ncbi:MAG: sigma-70 family RNA polymerase sigma factor [Balneolales bacterium]|nr:sigma-70 family RNA polymerase sigma factor [Balneolales bacterium]